MGKAPDYAWYPNYWYEVVGFYNIDRDEALLVEIGATAANHLELPGSASELGFFGLPQTRNDRFGSASEMNSKRRERRLGAGS